MTSSNGNNIAGIQPLSKTTLTARVSESLLAYILEEGLQDGQPLPSTAELAERYGVSRTVMREAIADLAARGVLARSQGREAVVISPGAEQIENLLRVRAARDQVTPEQVLQARRAIETITARLAAENRSDEDIASLREYLDKMVAATTDAAFHDSDVSFHETLARATGNPILLFFFEGISGLGRELRIRATSGRRARGDSFDGVNAAHRAIFDAVVAGDPEAADEAMTQHLMQVEEGLVALRQLTPPQRQARKRRP